MSRGRPTDFDLGEAIRRPEFTPRAADAAALVALAAQASDALRPALVRALSRIEPAALEAIANAAPTAPVEHAVELARLLGQLSPALTVPLLAAFAAREEPRLRRAAYVALGRLECPDALRESLETQLLPALATEAAPERRVLVETLGKLGRERTREALARVDAGDDADLARRLERAKLVLDRELTRGEALFLVDAELPATPAALTTRRGLESLVLEQVIGLGLMERPSVAGPGLVRGTVRGRLAKVYQSRLFLELAFPLGELHVADEAALARAVAERMAEPRVRELLARTTEGEPRVRVAWQGMGKRRALSWAVAAELAKVGIRNDSREATFELRVRETRDGLELTLVPRAVDDPRFRYRVGDVPAASHPTFAAALAYLAPLRADDVVWDPFVGSGTELVEVARRGARARLLGTDLSPEALDVARKNLERAAVQAELVLADATTYVPPARPTLIVTNPPMGRRVHRGDVTALLSATLAHVRRVAHPDATLVWISPIPRRTAEVAEGLGMQLERGLVVDMGGFDARLERWRVSPKR